MKKVKNQRKKTAIGQKRHAKAVARKDKKYNPFKVKRYYVVNDRAVQETTVSGKPLVADTEVLDLS
jgi:hypothetical protein